jgi:hypothetical protein
MVSATKDEARRLDQLILTMTLRLRELIARKMELEERQKRKAYLSTVK